MGILIYDNDGGKMSTPNLLFKPKYKQCKLYGQSVSLSISHPKTSELELNPSLKTDL